MQINSVHWEGGAGKPCPSLLEAFKPSSKSLQGTVHTAVVSLVPQWWPSFLQPQSCFLAHLPKMEVYHLHLRPCLRCVWGRPTFIHGCTASCLGLCFLTCKIESLPSQGQVHLLVCSIKSRNEEERKQNSTFRLTYRGTSGTQGPVHCSSYLLPTQSPGTGQWPGRQLS